MLFVMNFICGRGRSTSSSIWKSSQHTKKAGDIWRCWPGYTYSGIKRLACPWTPTLEHIREAITKTTGQTFNFVLVNRYKDGLDHMGEHRDDEKELDPLCPIASVSLGAARDFIFRHRDTRGKQNRSHIKPVKLELAHGSLLLMNPPTNTFWYHSLPIRKKVVAPRINLTFRRILISGK
uniref:DNA oxidative demethylase ALKBH2 n=1 Tax=Neogobius melanostomus TaxID=47308 RepID=A0A8C6UWH2_9GOBI